MKIFFEPVFGMVRLICNTHNLGIKPKLIKRDISTEGNYA